MKISNIFVRQCSVRNFRNGFLESNFCHKISKPFLLVFFAKLHYLTNIFKILIVFTLSCIFLTKLLKNSDFQNFEQNVWLVFQKWTFQDKKNKNIENSKTLWELWGTYSCSLTEIIFHLLFMQFTNLHNCQKNHKFFFSVFRNFQILET